MTRLAIKDNAITTLANELSINGLSVVLTDGSSFPASGPYIVTICLPSGEVMEKLLIESRSSNTLTVATGGRAYGGTTAAIHAALSQCFIGAVEELVTEIRAEIDLKVTGPASPTSGNIVAFDGATGKLVKDGGVLGSAAYTASTDYAVSAKGVTNGDSHDHAGGDGGQVDHGGLAGLGDDDHTIYVKHSLATAISDFLVASGAGAWVKKTLAEVKTILGLGTAAYTASGDYAVAAKGVTGGDSHDHAGGDGAQIDHGGLGGLSDDDHTQYLKLAGGTLTGVAQAADHATAANGEVANICYGTGSAPTASTVPIGTLFIKYTP